MTQLQPVEEPRTRVLDHDGLWRAARRIAHEIREHHTDLDRVVVAGIREGGVPVARMVSGALADLAQRDIATAALNVAGFRDDRPRADGSAGGAWTPMTEEPSRRFTADVTGAVVIVVDDVVQTGRTLRAAFDAVASLGRPAAIEAAVMVDRGGREIPIRPNYVGKNLPVPGDGWVEIVTAGPHDSGVFVVTR